MRLFIRALTYLHILSHLLSFSQEFRYFPSSHCRVYPFKFSPNKPPCVCSCTYTVKNKQNKKKHTSTTYTTLSVATVCSLQVTRTCLASSLLLAALWKLRLVVQSSSPPERKRQTRAETRLCTSAGVVMRSVQGHCQTPVLPEAAGWRWRWERC